MNKSDNIDLLSKALVKAQAEMPSVTMDATNPFFKSKYATLGAIIQASRPVLAKNGLAVSQLTTYAAEFENAVVGVETILVHESGQWLSNTVCLPVHDTAKIAQDAGSVITYLRRYSLAAILGIYSDEDDDGNANTAKPAQKAALQPSKIEPVGEPRFIGIDMETGDVYENVTMTLENAVTMRSTDGKMYADMDLPQLTAIYNAHGKKLKLADLPQEERARIERENAAIKSLIDSKRK